MTITAKYLREWEESSRIYITAEQERIILKRFGTEPYPYEWSEQGIATQIRNFLNYGHWEKPMTSHAEQSDLQFGDDVPF